VGLERGPLSLVNTTEELLFFVILFYLQSVLVYSANCVKTCIYVYSGM
jgi:hypothetical protein